jgi:hypothetical protein
MRQRIHPKVGISYVGNKWQLMALLNFLEKECSKEEMEAPPHSGTKGRGLNEENKRLRVTNLLHDWKVDIVCFQEKTSMFVTEFGAKFMVV